MSGHVVFTCLKVHSEIQTIPNFNERTTTLTLYKKALQSTPHTDHVEIAQVLPAA